MTKLDEALGLFPSVIKCGEQWSATCQAVLEAAKAELAELRAGPAATSVTDWEEMPQTRKLLSLVKEGVECEFDDSQVPIFFSDESDASVGLNGGVRLSLSCNYEVIPLSLLRDIKSAMGDNWERCLDLWRQTYASPHSRPDRGEG